MKIVRTASGKKTLKLSRKEWTNIGKKAGWISRQSKKSTEKDFDTDIEVSGWRQHGLAINVEYTAVLTPGEPEYYDAIKGEGHPGSPPELDIVNVIIGEDFNYRGVSLQRGDRLDNPRVFSKFKRLIDDDFKIEEYDDLVDKLESEAWSHLEDNLYDTDVREEEDYG